MIMMLTFVCNRGTSTVTVAIGIVFTMMVIMMTMKVMLVLVATSTIPVLHSILSMLGGSWVVISRVICPLKLKMGYNYSYLTYNPTSNYP